MSARAPAPVVAPSAIVVDDDTASGQSLALSLERIGWRVRAVGTIREAMDLLRTGPAELVVSDSGLPDGDGVAFLRSVASGWPKTVRVFYSGSPLTTRLREAVAQGIAVRHFRKGEDLQALLQLVRQGAPAEAGVPRVFLVRWGAHRRRLAPGEWVVGRASWAAIRLDDNRASREHAVLYVTAQTLSIEDRGSASGTFVNDRPVSGEARLSPGDRIRVGTTVLAVEVATPQDEATPPSGEVVVSEEVDFSTDVPQPASRTDAWPPSRPAGEPGRAAAAAPRAILAVLADAEWAEGIRRAATIHQDLRVEIRAPAEARAAIAAVSRGVLLLDLDAVGGARDRLLEAWRAPAPRGPVVIAANRPDHEGVVLARELGVAAYLRLGKAPMQVLGVLRYQLQRWESAK